MKVETVSLNLDALDRADALVIDKVKIAGPSTKANSDSGPLMINVIWNRRGSLTGDGNKMTARWRTRHGGAWLMALNKKFKVK